MVHYRRLPPNNVTRSAKMIRSFLIFLSALALASVFELDASIYPARNRQEAMTAFNKLKSDIALGWYGVEEVELIEYVNHLFPEDARLPRMKRAVCAGVSLSRAGLEPGHPMLGDRLHGMALCAMFDGKLSEAARLLNEAIHSEKLFLEILRRKRTEQYSIDGREALIDRHYLEQARIKWMQGDASALHEAVVALQKKYAKDTQGARELRLEIILVLAYANEAEMLRQYLQHLTSKENLALCQQFLGDDDFEAVVLNPVVVEGLGSIESAEGIAKRYYANRIDCHFPFVNQ